MLGEALAGWVIARVLDTIARISAGALDDVRIRRAVTNALESASAHLGEQAQDDVQREIQLAALEQLKPALFGAALQRLEAQAGAIDQISVVQSAMDAVPVDALQASGLTLNSLHAFANAFDAELWNAPATADLRGRVSQRLQETGTLRLLSELVPDTSVEATHTRVRHGARGQLAKRRRFLDLPAHVVPRFARRSDDDEQRLHSPDAIARSIESGWSAAFVDIGGSGKSTFLILLSNALMAENWAMSAIVAPVREVALSGSVIAAMLDSHEMRRAGVTEADLRLMLDTGRLTVMFDGWNEVNRDQRGQFKTAIDVFRRDYPHAPVVTASRPTAAPLPYPIENWFVLDRVSRMHQKEFVGSVAQDAGRLAFEQVQDQPDVADLLGIPFFLSLFANLDFNAPLPDTRNGLLSACLEMEFQRPIHLDPPPGLNTERQTQYMRALAEKMTADGDTEVGEQDALTSVQAVNQTMDGAGAIAAPNDALLHLGQHSLMRRIQRGQDVSYAFTHELFQNWFASFVVEAAVQSDHANALQPPGQAATDFGNHAKWAEPVRLACERMGSWPDAAQAIQRFLKSMIGIDAFFAAELLAGAGDQVWANLRDDVEAFIEHWTAQGADTEAFQFMIRIGRPELSDRVWANIENREPQDIVGLSRYRSFSPEVLGPDWLARLLALDNEAQYAIVHDLALDGGIVGLERACQAVLANPVHSHVDLVLHELEYAKRADLLGGLVDEFSNPQWENWSLRQSFRDMVLPLRRAAVTAALQRVARTEGNPKRLDALLILTDLGEHQLTADLVEQCLDAEIAAPERRSVYAHKLASAAPRLLSNALFARVLNGQRTPFRLRHFIVELDDDQRERLYDHLLDAEADRYDALQLATHLKSPQLRRALQSLFALDAQRANRENPDQRALDRQRTRYADLLKQSNERAFTQLMINTAARSSEEALALCELAEGWRRQSDEGDNYLNPSDAPRLALGAQAARWCELILDAPNTPRSGLATAALAMSRIGTARALGIVDRLLERELDQHQRELERFRRPGGHRDPAAASARYNVNNQFGWAFERLQSPATMQVLQRYLRDDRFAVEAARKLIAYAPHRVSDITRPPALIGRSPKLIRQRRRELALRPATQACPDPSALVLDRIAELSAPHEADIPPLAFDFGHAAASMDLGPRQDELVTLLRNSPNPIANLDILTSLSASGAVIDADLVRPGLLAALEHWHVRPYRNEQDYWRLRRWLDLMALSTRPSELTQHVAACDPSLHDYQIRDLANAIIADDPVEELAAVTSLTDLMREPDRGAENARASALLRTGTPEAFETLLNDYFEGRGQREVVALPVSGNPLSLHLQESSESFEFALEKVRQSGDFSLAIHHLEGLVEGMRSIARFQQVVEDVIANGPEEERSLAPLLAPMLKPLCVDSEATEHGWSRLLPRPCADVRALLWHRMIETGDPNHFWSDLLSRTDRLVDDYGRHPDDPRHPNIADGAPWPPAAAPLWQL